MDQNTFDFTLPSRPFCCFGVCCFIPADGDLNHAHLRAVIQDHSFVEQGGRRPISSRTAVCTAQRVVVWSLCVGVCLFVCVFLRACVCVCVCVTFTKHLDFFFLAPRQRLCPLPS